MVGHVENLNLTGLALGVLDKEQLTLLGGETGNIVLVGIGGAHKLRTMVGNGALGAKGLAVGDNRLLIAFRSDTLAHEEGALEIGVPLVGVGVSFSRSEGEDVDAIDCLRFLLETEHRHILWK